jgi:hypothetical protein
MEKLCVLAGVLKVADEWVAAKERLHGAREAETEARQEALATASHRLMAAVELLRSIRSP